MSLLGHGYSMACSGLYIKKRDFIRLYFEKCASSYSSYLEAMLKNWWKSVHNSHIHLNHQGKPMYEEHSCNERTELHNQNYLDFSQLCFGRGHTLYKATC